MDSVELDKENPICSNESLQTPADILANSGNQETVTKA